MSIFHRKRRDIVSKTLFDIGKLTLVATCVSGFFPGFSGVTRVGIFLIIALTFILGFIICPSLGKED
jgi:hypothetical protein